MEVNRMEVNRMATDIIVTFDPIPDITPEAYLALRGEKGEKGDTGTGISSIAQNLDGTLSINLDDGTSYETEPLRGEDGADGADGADGVSPTVSFSEITGGHSMTVVDADGTHSINIMDGADGADGTDGTDGADGTSPAVSFSDITGGHSMTVVDAIGTHSINIMDGADGAKGDKGDKGDTGASGSDGYSPTATVTKSGSTATITITDKNGTTTASVNDGQTYTAGTGISISNGVISLDLSQAEGSNY